MKISIPIDGFHLKQELYSMLQTLLNFGLVALVAAGVCGTIYKVFSPEGWVANAFGRSLSAGVAAIGSLALVAGLAWFSRGAGRGRNTVTDLTVVCFAAAGLLYIGRIVFLGAL